MHIEQVNHEKNGYFRAIDEGEEAGLMSYTWDGDTRFIIDHTEVNPAFSGQGVGKKLVMQAVAFARESNVAIIPQCPFAKSVFDKTPEIADVLS